MAEAMRLETPLHHVRDSTVHIEEAAPCAYINLRGSGEAFFDAVERALGLRPPVTPNTCVADAGSWLCWLSPDEWLAAMPVDQLSALLTVLERNLAGQHCAVTDVSSGLTTLNVLGARAAELLARGCPLDLHPRQFAVGQCAQTLLAKAGVLIAPLTDRIGFRLTVRRSFAHYLWHWLTDARFTAFPSG